MVDSPLDDSAVPLAAGPPIDVEPVEPFVWGPEQEALEDLAERLDELLSTRFGDALRSITCDWVGNKIRLGWRGEVPSAAVAAVKQERADGQRVEFAKPDRRRELITRWRMIRDLTAQLSEANFAVVKAWKSADSTFVEVELEAEPLERRVEAAHIARAVDSDPDRRVRLHWAATPHGDVSSMTDSGDVRVLDIRIDATTPNYPGVQLLIDGVELLDHDGDGEPNTPAAILLSDALVPTDPPTRVAFYGCGCGEFGCTNVAGLITREGHRIVWSDFRSLTGAYSSALPDGSLDPYASDHDGFHDHSELALPPLQFDAEQYLATVAAATADRSWVNRTQAVINEIRALRPGLQGIFADTRGERIQINYRRPGEKMLDWAELDIPSGSPAIVAASLIKLLEGGTTLDRIKRQHLCR